MTSASKPLYAYSRLTKVKLTRGAKLRVKEKLFSEIGATENTGLQSIWNFFKYLNTASLLFAPVVVLVIITITSKVSSVSVPGDLLYPVKRVTEDSRMILAPSDKVRVNLQIKFAEERLVEFEKVKLKESSKDTPIVDTATKPAPFEFQPVTKQDPKTLIEVEIKKTIQSLTATSNSLRNSTDYETRAAVSTTLEKLVNVSNGHMSIPATPEPSPSQEVVPAPVINQSSPDSSPSPATPAPEVLGASTENPSVDQEVLTPITSNVNKVEEETEENNEEDTSNQAQPPASEQNTPAESGAQQPAPPASPPVDSSTQTQGSEAPPPSTPEQTAQ